ncbi:hypothetical protein CVT24_008404 [Panaeolus cyanescens]|uniref:Ras GEF n=1 Tax=Panaeolus cyanescens TaxID=181874 RepID=A0A409VBC8_9AGAR|nr:hypothetical protein CVT24_008404 [Panaeolus cyanescens]
MSNSNDSFNKSQSEISSLNDFVSSSQTVNLTVPDSSAIFLQSPAPSFAESFSTAFSSSSADENQLSIPLASPALAPPQSLRKSISVDSFAQYGRDGAHSSRSHVTQPPESPREFHVSPLPGPLSHPEKPVWTGRNRGESLSFVHKEASSGVPLDSDIDRYDPQNANTMDRFRRSSLKAPESPKALIRGGDLPLPSRAPNLTLTSSLSSLRSTSTASSSRESRDGSIYTSSSQNPSKRTSNYSAAPSGRQRSGSLGVHMGGSSRKTATTSYIPPIQTRSVGKDIVLLVIGTKGCGKSTLIRTGLARFERKEQQISSDGTSPYQCANYKIQLDENESFVSVSVIETELQLSLGLVKWPNNLPPIDGIIICYDSSNMSSYQPIELLLRGYRSVSMPLMVLECKSDLKHQIDSTQALQTLKQYDTGLIKVSSQDDAGRHKMWQSFRWILKAILRQRGSNSIIDDRNPASPTLLTNKDALWERSSANTPTGSPMMLNHSNASPTVAMMSNSRKPDLPKETQPSTSIPSIQQAGPLASAEDIGSEFIPSNLTLDVSEPIPANLGENLHHHDTLEHPQNLPERQSSSREKKNGKKTPRPSQWADLDDLLDKLLFLAVSGDDPTFTTHFLLTYRRFATPRSVLLAMQKRMRQLDNPTGDPMFACFAQMRICHLLEIWIRDYSHDFSVKGTAGALNALIKSIISKTHLLHYGSEFLPFLEQLSSLVDQDAAWALKADISDNDSDDYEEEEEDARDHHVDLNEQSTVTVDPPPSSTVAFPSRERKPSLPPPKALLSSHPNGTVTQDSKHYLRDLVKLASDVVAADSGEIAQEITRQGVRLFLAIKPRDWLAFTFVSGKKKDTEPISAFNAMSNHLAAWVVSLILCHDRLRNRTRLIEKFVEIGQKLRAMNNYSALRAFVAGINNAADDATMENFKQKSPDAAKNLMSWDVLLQQIRSHRAYRLALRNSKGACIPAMEVHISDLIKAHEGNGDINEDAPTKIHWGKFNMMGRFITSTLQCQAQCRNSNDYDFPERPAIAELITRRPVMSEEMQKSRLDSNDFDIDESHPAPVPSSRADVPGLRKLFFW